MVKLTIYLKLLQWIGTPLEKIYIMSKINSRMVLVMNNKTTDYQQNQGLCRLCVYKNLVTQNYDYRIISAKSKCPNIFEHELVFASPFVFPCIHSTSVPNYSGTNQTNQHVQLDVLGNNIQQIIELHTKLQPVEEIQNEICRKIEDLIRGLGLPKGNRGSIACSAELSDDLRYVKLYVKVVNAHKPCGRCPYLYSLTSELIANIDLLNPNPDDVKFCIRTPFGGRICIDGSDILEIIIGSL